MDFNGEFDAQDQEMFDLYIYNHLKTMGMHEKAEEFKAEVGLETDRARATSLSCDIQPDSQPTTTQQVQQQHASSQAASADGTENVNLSQMAEEGTSRNTGKLPMYLYESTNTAAVSSSVWLQEHQDINEFVGQFIDDNIASFSRRDQQQVDTLQDILAKGKFIANTADTEIDLFAAQEAAALGEGSSNDAGLISSLLPPVPPTIWPLSAGSIIGPHPVTLGSRNTFLRGANLEPEFMPTPGLRSTVLRNPVDHIAPVPTFSGSSNALSFREVEVEKAAAGTFSSPSSNQAESSGTSSSFLKRKNSQWNTDLEGIVFEEIFWLQSGIKKLLTCHFSTDGKLLAGAGQDKRVFIWDMDTIDMRVTSESHTHIITDVRFCPNSTVLATSSFDRNLGIWDASTVTLLGKLVGHTASVTSLDFHQRNANILCSSDTLGEVRLWNVNQGVTLRVLKDSPRLPLTHRSRSCKQVRFNPQGGNLLAAASGNTIRIVDVETDSTQLYLEGHTGDVRAICWDPSGRYVASVSADSARIFSVASRGRCIHELPSDGYNFQSCTYHPKYSELLVIGSYQSIGLWNLFEGAKSMNPYAHEDTVAALSASPQNGMVASASYDESIKLWK